MALPTVYFAHPINSYGTKLEPELIKKIELYFKICDVENPNQKKHHDECKRRKDAGLNVMEYFFKEVIPGCAACVCLPFRDGLFGAGIYGEAEIFHQQGKRIFSISPDGEIKEIKFKDMIGLSIEKTRERIKTAY